MRGAPCELSRSGYSRTKRYTSALLWAHNVGSPGLPFPLEDIPHAQVILLVGGNVAATMPPIMQYFDEQRRRGGRLIVADPRVTQTARASSLHLQLTPGTDAALANGLLHIVTAQGLLDSEFIAQRTS